MKVKLTSSFEIAAEFNTELQHPSENVSFPNQSLFSWFKNLNTLQRGLFYVFFLTWRCVVPCVPTHTDVLYISAASTQLLAGSLRQPRHSPCTLTPVWALPRTAWGLCSTSASKHAGDAFLCLRKGFAFGLTPLVHFRKSKLKHPLKGVCTEHGILSCSSPLNMAFLFPFFCFCLTVRDASFLAWQLCRKIIIPHFVLRTSCAERFYRVLEVEREGGCGGSTVKTGSTEYR